MGLMIMLFTVVLAFCLYLKIRKDLSNVWHGFFGNKSIKEVIANREIQAQETPKTLFGMLVMMMKIFLIFVLEMNLSIIYTIHMIKTLF